MEMKEALIQAMKNEIKSQNLYKIMASSISCNEGKKLYESFIPLEKIHEEKLREVYAAKFPDEQLDLPEDILPVTNTVNASSDIEEIIEFALIREDYAAEHYEMLAEIESNPETKQLFVDLAEEEKKHSELLKFEQQRMHGAAIWFDESELNGLFEY